MCLVGLFGIIVVMPLEDARGREFTPFGPSARFVSLVPSITEMLFAFGAGERVVGVTDYCTYPSEGVKSKAKIGGTKNPRVGQVLALHPDLVIANMEENRRADVERMEAEGIPVFVTFAHTVQGAIMEMWDIAALVGAGNTSEIVVPIERMFAHWETKPHRRRPRVFCPIWRDPWMTANGETYIGDLIRICGGENVFDRRERRFPLAADLALAQAARAEGRDTRYPRVSLKEILAAKPEIILLPDEPYRFTVQDALELKAIPGLEHARVDLVDGTLVSWYGVRLGRALETIGNLLEEEAV